MRLQSDLSAVGVFAPWADADERALRVRLQKAHTIAAARAARERNHRAWLIYSEAAALASSWVFQRVDDLGDLERILRALNQLFVAADNIVQVEG